MRVVVIGAGVIGVTTAYFLAAGGAEVTVVERQPGPGLETSFANGGQISANHATPWATPSTPWKAVKWLGRGDAPLLFHLRFDPALFRWLIRFLTNCRRSAMARNIERALRVALYSRQELVKVREQTGIAYDQLCLGILHIFRNRREYDEALAGVELMNRLGCRRRPVSPTECLTIEPALASVADRLIGGIHSPDDESGDAFRFTERLAAICAERGVHFRYGTDVLTLDVSGQRVEGVRTASGRVSADAVVVAAGSFSPLLLRPCGLRLPVYPAKGYSVTLPIVDVGKAPAVALIDDEFKLVYSRLGDRLRIAGSAEFTGYDASVRPERAQMVLNQAMTLFPGCGNPQQAELWAGLRPSTPDGVPVLGPTPIRNLFLNTGHGTLGWTMACGAGHAVADIVLGRRPGIDLDGLTLARFG